MMKKYILDITALLAGIASVFAFAPYYFFWIAYLTPAALLFTWLNASAWRAAWRGFIFGVGYFGFGVYWIYISIHHFGGANLFVSALLTATFISALSSLFAIFGYLLARYFKANNAYKLILAFPAGWVLCEWTREWLFTGFPWLYIGTTQTNGFLRGFAPLVGTFGTSFLTILIAGLIVYIILTCGLKRIIAALSIITLLFVGDAISAIQWTASLGKPIKVTLVQGNIPQSLKWNPETIPLSLKRYEALTATHWSNKLIVWPENSIPLPLPEADAYLTRIDSLAKKHHTTILLGVPVPLPNEINYYNSMLAIGDAHGIYFKRHLVPFGEYLPFSSLLSWFTNYLNIPMSTFIPGAAKQKLITTNGIKVAPFICYEIAYSNLVRSDLPQATLLVTISDDAWFGDSFAAWQHLQIGQMQALSAGRDLLFSTNNGVTAIVNDQGQIIKSAPRNETLTLSGMAQARQGATPWVILGNWPIILGCFLIFIIRLFYKKKL